MTERQQGGGEPAYRKLESAEIEPGSLVGKLVEALGSDKVYVPAEEDEATRDLLYRRGVSAGGLALPPPKFLEPIEDEPVPRRPEDH